MGKRALTNVEPFDGIHEIVAQAAKLTNRRVWFQSRPIPKDPNDRAYTPDPSYGSIWSEDYGMDHSDFWDTYTRLKAEAGVPLDVG